MKHFINTEELTRREIDGLIELSEMVAAKPQTYANALKGKIVATIFFEPSTRTRLSFESAILKLGAGLISTENGAESSSARKSETIEDTVKVLSGYADAIVMRHTDNNSVIRAASVSPVPVINGGSGSSAHPSQSLLDAYTIKRHKGTLDGVKLAVCGDLKLGRTANSLIKLLSKYDGLQVWALSVVGMELTPDVVEFMEQNKIPYNVCESFDDIPKDVDVIYMTRFQKERADDGLNVWTRANTVNPASLILTPQVVKRFSDSTIVLHPLPRVDEIDMEIDNDPRAKYFEQAHNGVPTRMAVLLKVLGGA